MITDLLYAFIRWALRHPKATLSAQEAVRLAREDYQHDPISSFSIKPYIAKRQLRYYKIAMHHTKGGNIYIWVDVVDGKLCEHPPNRPR